VQVYGQGVIKKALSFIFADDWQKALAEHPALIQTLEDLQNMTWPCFHAALDNETIASASTGMRHSQEKQVTAGRGILCKYPEYQHPAAASPGHEATWVPPGSDGRPCARTTWATKVPVLGADVTTLWQRHNGRWASRGDLVIKEHWRGQLKIAIDAMAPFRAMNLKLLARARVLERDIQPKVLATATIFPPIDDCIDGTRSNKHEAPSQLLVAAIYRYLWTGNLPPEVSVDTPLAEFNRYHALMDRSTASAMEHHGGIRFTGIIMTSRCDLVLHFRNMLQEIDCNRPATSQTTAQTILRGWIAISLKGVESHPDVATMLERTTWKGPRQYMHKRQLPERHIRMLLAWERARAHMELAEPATYEQVMSMPLFGSSKITKSNMPLQPLDNLEWVTAGCTTIGNVWTGDSFNHGGRTLRPNVQIQGLVPREWQTILQKGPTPYAPGDWVLFDADPLPEEHVATGIRTSAGQLLGQLHGVHEDTWSVRSYVLTINGWILDGARTCALAAMQHATVESWPPHRGNTPDEVTLVGPTHTSWARSISRLTWAGATGAPLYYRCLISAKRRNIARLWRPTPTAPHTRLPKAQAIADALACDPALGLGKALHCIKTRIFKVETADFMYAVAVGALHVGRGYGDTKEDRDDDICLSCRQYQETLEHIFTCPAYKPLRAWTRKALKAVTGYNLHGQNLASFLAFGYNTDILYKRSAVAIREAAMESIRSARNSRLKSEHARIDADVAGRRLQQSIRHDYTHAVGSDDYGGHMQAAVSRWHPDAYVPATRAHFNRAWKPLARIHDDRLDTHGLIEYGLMPGGFGPK
jgi:hypothetical protein